MSGHEAIALENAALRLQLAAFQRKRRRPVVTSFDRVFWITLRACGPGGAVHLIYVQADAVVRWQRETVSPILGSVIETSSSSSRPALYGPRASRSDRTKAAANPLWRAARIHVELKMLGIAISERTVSRILRRLRRPPSQMWKTFLHNHLGQMVSIDFFTSP
jgi:hypothetical protein